MLGIVGTRVTVWSYYYMGEEISYKRFTALLLAFFISIVILLLFSNLFLAIIGWDALGVTSFLLVIYYKNRKSLGSGIITALTNRLGDCFLLVILGICLLSRQIGSCTHFLLILLLFTSITKRAQIPFSSWLPSAIAAPTPVSALVHSSTLVTAGVYLLIRYNILLFSTSNTYILFFVGLVTTVIAGSAAMLEIDIKKVIALSTLRQLGVMMTIIGAGKPLLAYLHLLSHAYFKAILFICAGIIIHNIKDYQDIRTIGGMYISMPKVSSIINVANIRLCGLPFMRGFYSKDRILEAIFMSNTNILVFMLVLLATILTVCYSCRLSLYLSASTVKLETRYYISEIDKFIILGIIFLLPFSVMGGLNLI